MYATIASATRLQATYTARVWTVRAGSTGTGPDLFEVYADTMAAARESVQRTATDVQDWMSSLLEAGYTVHADQAHRAAALQFNLYGHVTPAPDFMEWDEEDGPEIRLDTVDGQVDATFLADDGAGMILALVDGQLQEHPAEALLPRCECGNPFRLCHPDA